MVKIGMSLLLCLASIFQSARAETRDEREILHTIKGFYVWILKHGPVMDTFQPHIADKVGSNQFYLDRSNEAKFAGYFMRSGLFASDFPQKLSAYYEPIERQIEKISNQEFDDIARDGRGPMMEAEDMDVYFCAQEYEYKRDFVFGMRLKSLLVERDHAHAIVISPLSWETTFEMERHHGRWLIAGYCLYK